MRVKRNFNSVVTGEPGITPAHAGKTNFVVAYVIKYEDHPRACG